MAHRDDVVVTFGSGKKVMAQVGNHLIATDQPADNGGEDSAPAPYSLFLAAIGTCAGIYVLGFLQSRKLPTEGVRLKEELQYNEETGVLAGVRLTVELPETIPEKYHAAILRAVEGCAVKKAIQAQPQFAVQIQKTA